MSYLTDDEHRAMTLTVDLATLLAEIISDGEARTSDYAELAAHLHVIQNAVLAQAAARAYPGRYRLLGGGAL